MGFRGEALASIGAVSQARVLSRTVEHDAAYEIFNRGGDISGVQAAAGNVGTTVEVRNLFFNVPARRKFIKGTSTEFGHISDALLRLALPHPLVHFRLLHNGRTTLDLPETSEEERLLAAWPDEFREQRLTLTCRDVEVRLRAASSACLIWPAPPPNTSTCYLNGRHIRDRFIQHAVREAYRGLTEPGRHPAAILLLEIPPADVDVNVHPTKIEVRFRDSGRMHGLVLSSIREVLLGNDLSPTAIPISAQDERRGLNCDRSSPSFSSSFPATWPRRTAPRFRPRRSSRLRRGGPGFRRSHRPICLQSPRGHPASLNPHPPLPPPSPAIQLHNSYLVAQSDDGLVIIDQHALHERIMYEELLSRLQRGPLESQRMLIPHTVNVSETQMSLLNQIQPLLGKLGIEVAPFGPGVVAVHSFPSFLEKLEPGTFVRELLERGEQELLDLHEEELLHEVLDMMACKAAVKAGDPLTPQEIEALLSRRELVEPQQQLSPRPPYHLAPLAPRAGKAVQAHGVLKTGSGQPRRRPIMLKSPRLWCRHPRTLPRRKSCIENRWTPIVTRLFSTRTRRPATSPRWACGWRHALPVW